MLQTGWEDYLGGGVLCALAFGMVCWDHSGSPPRGRGAPKGVLPKATDEVVAEEAESETPVEEELPTLYLLPPEPVAYQSVPSSGGEQQVGEKASAGANEPFGDDTPSWSGLDQPVDRDVVDGLQSIEDGLKAPEYFFDNAPRSLLSLFRSGQLRLAVIEPGENQDRTFFFEGDLVSPGDPHLGLRRGVFSGFSSRVVKLQRNAGRLEALVRKKFPGLRPQLRAVLFVELDIDARVLAAQRLFAEGKAVPLESIESTSGRFVLRAGAPVEYEVSKAKLFSGKQLTGAVRAVGRLTDPE